MTADQIAAVAGAAATELQSATEKFGAFASPHEGFAVIQEEVDELWAEIKGGQDVERMRDEAVQVAAMAMRFVGDLCGLPRAAS